MGQSASIWWVWCGAPLENLLAPRLKKLAGWLRLGSRHTHTHGQMGAEVFYVCGPAGVQYYSAVVYPGFEGRASF
jgi:hypothetical protein